MFSQRLGWKSVLFESYKSSLCTGLSLHPGYLLELFGSFTFKFGPKHKSSTNVELGMGSAVSMWFDMISGTQSTGPS